MTSPRPGQTFEHRHYVRGDGASRRPDICRVTRVTNSTVYYHTETGAKRCTDHYGFAERCVLRWLPDTEGAHE